MVSIIIPSYKKTKSKNYSRIFWNFAMKTACDFSFVHGTPESLVDNESGYSMQTRHVQIGLLEIIYVEKMQWFSSNTSSKL